MIYVLCVLWIFAITLFSAWFVGYPIYKLVMKENVLDDANTYLLGLACIALGINVLTIAIKACA